MQATEENMYYATFWSHWHQCPSKPHSAAVWEENDAAEDVFVCSLPERAEGLVVVDVSWTQGSYHRSARIPP